jgi:hypothetical protein
MKRMENLQIKWRKKRLLEILGSKWSILAERDAGNSWNLMNID